MHASLVIEQPQARPSPIRLCLRDPAACFTSLRTPSREQRRWSRSPSRRHAKHRVAARCQLQSRLGAEPQLLLQHKPRARLVIVPCKAAHGLLGRPSWSSTQSPGRLCPPRPVGVQLQNRDGMAILVVRSCTAAVLRVPTRGATSLTSGGAHLLPVAADGSHQAHILHCLLATH